MERPLLVRDTVVQPEQPAVNPHQHLLLLDNIRVGSQGAYLLAVWAVLVLAILAPSGLSLRLAPHCQEVLIQAGSVEDSAGEWVIYPLDMVDQMIDLVLVLDFPAALIPVFRVRLFRVVAVGMLLNEAAAAVVVEEVAEGIICPGWVTRWNLVKVAAFR